MKYIQDSLTEIKAKLEIHNEMIEEKVDKGTLQGLLSSKVSNTEINELLPDMTMYE